MDNYYRLILVDDEDEVRGRISSKISEESGFKVVGTAGNGHDALELIEKYSPHVVITDIRMPYIDGIELTKIIKREYPMLKVAFITGYDEFDYAREAIELGVKSYLTKPLTQNDISKFLKKLKKELDDEFKRILDRELLEARYNESISVLIDNYFSSLLSMDSSESESEIEFLKNNGINLENKKYKLVMFTQEKSGDPDDILKNEKNKILVRTFARETFSKRKFEFYYFLYYDSVIFIVVNNSDNFNIDFDESLLEIIQVAENYCSLKINAGVSRNSSGFGSLRKAYMESRRAVASTSFLPSGRIAYIEQVENIEISPVVMDESDNKRLEYLIRFGTDSEVEEVLTSELDRIRNISVGIPDYRLYLLNLANTAVSFAATSGINFTEINKEDIFETLNRLTNPEDMVQWFIEIIGKIRSENKNSRKNNSDLLFNNAAAYINMHFEDPDLSMEKVCSSIGISVSYLSLLFKKKTGKTFVKYLTELRVEKACELLKYSGDRIIEIAEKCGYRDVYYFSHSFKKYIGMSPKSYREKQTAE